MLGRPRAGRTAGRDRRSGPPAGATLRFLAAAIGARAVVEVGTGGGWPGCGCCAACARDGVLTSIDVDPEQPAGARTAFVSPGSARRGCG